VETLHVAPDGTFQEEGEYRIPGVAGTASPIGLAFLKPGGSMTGQLFPSGAQQETLTVQSRCIGPFTVRVSLVDAANPFVLVDAASLPVSDTDRHPDDPAFLSVIEDIRREGAVRFGLAADVEAASIVRGTPKIALLSAAAEDNEADLRVLAFTMGKAHASLQLTGAVCVGAAAVIHGTIAWELAQKGNRDTRPKHGMSVGSHQIAPPLPVGIRHPAGVIHVEAVLGMDHMGEVSVDNVAVFRTARRLFEGNVYYRV
jgi:2-methylaconitate cis-trans-isomerase PrpF